MSDPSAANDEGITALHNAICAGHFDIVRFLVLFGCDVNAQVSNSNWNLADCSSVVRKLLWISNILSARSSIADLGLAFSSSYLLATTS